MLWNANYKFIFSRRERKFAHLLDSFIFASLVSTKSQVSVKPVFLK